MRTMDASRPSLASMGSLSPRPPPSARMMARGRLRWVRSPARDLAGAGCSTCVRPQLASSGLMCDLLSDNLRELQMVRATGAAVKGTSCYPALSNVPSAVGKTLKPRVRCVINIANQGAGLPDGGLFTPDQLQRGSGPDPTAGQTPSRGGLEVKWTGEDVAKVSEDPQVNKYWERYGQVLVTKPERFHSAGQGHRRAQGRAGGVPPRGQRAGVLGRGQVPEQADRGSGRAVHRVPQA